MDPISASNYNLRALEDGEKEEETVDAATASVSTKSLGRFEQRNLKNLLPQIIATLIVTSNHIVVGVGLAYSAILIPQLESDDSDISITKDEMSWIASVVALVAPVGSILSGFMMDKIGRINTLKISLVPGVVGWVLMAVSQNVPTLIVARIFTGLATTLSTSPAVVYITEIARKDMRGSFLAVGPTYVSLGLVITYLKGWLMNWRTIAWICNAYLIIPFFLLFVLPESPPWLISKGRNEEAGKALQWLYKYQPDPEQQNKTFADMYLNLLIKEDGQKKAEAKATGGNMVKEFLKPTGYKPLLIISGVFFFQQFSGIYIFLFFSVTFFQAVGSDINPYVASIWIGVIRLFMSILNTWMLKFFGRRLLIMISASGMAVCTLISGLFTYWIKNGTTEAKWVPVIFLLFYVVSSMVGLLTIPWTMTAELFPLKIRSMAHSISTSIVNLIMFVAVQNYINMEEFFGGSAGIQWFFSVVSALTVIYIFIFLPETHRKKLSEIEDYFKSNTMYLGRRKGGLGGTVRDFSKNKNGTAGDFSKNKKSSGSSDKLEGDKLINHV